MNHLFAALTGEVFRPLATLIVPGLIVLLPYRVIFDERLRGAGISIPSDSLWSLIFVGTMAIFVGMLIDDLATYIEDGWDDKKPEPHTENWYKYLQLSFSTEPVGHRYLRTLVLKLKFELNVYLALLIGSPGIALASESLSADAQFGIVVVALTLAILLRYASQQTHTVLSRLRARMLEAYSPPHSSTKVVLPNAGKPFASEKKVEAVFPPTLLFVGALLSVLLAAAAMQPSDGLIARFASTSLGGQLANADRVAFPILVALSVVTIIVFVRKCLRIVGRPIKCVVRRKISGVREQVNSWSWVKSGRQMVLEWCKES